VCFGVIVHFGCSYKLYLIHFLSICESMPRGLAASAATKSFWTASFEYHHWLPIDGAKRLQENFAREAYHDV
jgi:hypothetical protein